ncbi:ATP-dependent (S)-NAD(P)H-hydrate dehydratase-like [Ylistrum balloti]|uniref:ATP-dependent (S)-NAD(P)H-hydrate dehydratase-like n=1 Tax=Ylistrum balloti TaxID=509963 RepID=UPI002905D63E|nr:ATP-dependent (S)-NAD(P)H-hydrate dehydratase-like [Ylistrum balloti]
MFALSSVFAYVIGKYKIPSSAVFGCPKHASYQNSGQLLEMAKSIIPPLSNDQHKGMMGRIGVVGGCQEYTGAPYFAAISSLKMGADLSHVFCTQDSASVIKSYSPELIVHPILDSDDALSQMEEWLPRLHAIVLGPGLGRSAISMKNATAIIEFAKKREIPLVIDADGLYLLQQNPGIIFEYTKAILTPNVVEFNRLYEKAMDGEKQQENDPILNAKMLSKRLGHVTIVKKGENDIITNGNHVLVCGAEGSPRRCGGQGDLLSGTMGTLTHWSHMISQEGTTNELVQAFGPTITAAYTACLLTRQCSQQAFAQCGRSMTTSDMIAQLPKAFNQLYL